MNELNLLNVKEHWHVLKKFGYTHSFFDLTIPVITATWAILGVIVLLTIFGRFFFRSKDGIVRYILLSITEMFMDLSNQTLGNFYYGHFSFVFSLFIFIFLCNTISLLPHLEEPTADLNTPLALGIISFLYANFYAIKTRGAKEYSKEFFQPIFIMFPINVIGKLASIISISFRLFGNILGGSIIANIYTAFVTASWSGILANFTGFNLIITFFFVIFEGTVQAFVFSMLSLTYLSLGLQGEHSEGN